MPATALKHFQEDIARARAIVAHADLLPHTTDAERLLRSDLFRSARRHDCIHNCDRPKMSPQPLDRGGTVLKVIQDIEYLVHRSNEHINTEFRHFLMGVGCSAATIAQTGYQVNPTT